MSEPAAAAIVQGDVVICVAGIVDRPLTKSATVRFTCQPAALPVESMIVNGATWRLVSCGLPFRVTGSKLPIVGAPAGSKSSDPAFTVTSACADGAKAASDRSAVLPKTMSFLNFMDAFPGSVVRLPAGG